MRAITAAILLVEAENADASAYGDFKYGFHTTITRQLIGFLMFLS